MIEHPNQSAREYLLESSNGEPIEFTDLPVEDDGPFGGDGYVGVSRLSDLDVENTNNKENQFVTELAGFNGFVSDVALTFIEREDWPLQWDSSFSFANLLLMATPCDPKGPFTISVYQDFTLCGWLIGPEAEVFACDLVDNFDFGTVVMPIERLENSEAGLVFKYKRQVHLDVV